MTEDEIAEVVTRAESVALVTRPGFTRSDGDRADDERSAPSHRDAFLLAHGTVCCVTPAELKVALSACEVLGGYNVTCSERFG